MNHYIDWINPKNSEQCNWAIHYLRKLPHVTFERGLHDKITKIERAFNCIPRSQKKERKRLMKAAWAQQKLKSDKKISSQYRLSKKAKNGLVKIAMENKKSLSETIELLIANELEDIQQHRESVEAKTNHIKELTNNRIIRLERKYETEIQKLEEEQLRLERLLFKTLMNNNIFKVRLESNKCSGKVLPNVLLKLKNKASKVMERNGIEVTEKVTTPENKAIKPIKLITLRKDVLKVFKS